LFVKREEKNERERESKREKQFSNVKVGGSGCVVGMESSSSFPLFFFNNDKKKEDNS
jgi:hypothetical protein